jgi:gamma-glutamylcyclotransferase (GGCT)/AIG2-like uncharacterized protein YtfP
MKCYVFAYGTLRNANVRKQVLGYVTTPQPSALKGFRMETIRLGTSEYPILCEDKNSQIAIEGDCFEIDEKDLLLLDAYETEIYRRVKIYTENDIYAWVYCK